MFADIAGFTAWSSEREPAQVFVLLETVYRNFDKLAKRLGVFKVETIGDCYVAATGLPEPQRDHAVVLARFAWECVLTMGSTCKGLEATLGPGTAELALRVGLHSGPTTAGVLRGEKSRFQLFGDTMNTASRMESNGIKNMVQVSQSTADLLMARGKQHWLTQREDKIEAKGKGTMQVKNHNNVWESMFDKKKVVISHRHL
jgi:class 3 adenylate cyclase